MSRREFTVTKFKPDPVLNFTATVTHASGEKVRVDFRYGSWQANRKNKTRAEVLPHVAAVLSSKIPRKASTR